GRHRCCRRTGSNARAPRCCRRLARFGGLRTKQLRYWPRALDRGESMVLQAMAEGYPGAGPEDADLLDLLDGFPSARPPFSELVAALDPLQPRLYSIASSPKHVPGEVHLAVAAVRYEKRARPRLGVASTYLADRVAAGARV